MDRRVTIRDIANATGFHYSTVSLALRDSPRIKEPVRQEIQKAAAKLGYTPDPMVRALAAYRNAVRPAGDYGTLAWLSSGPSLKLGANYTHRRYAEGALNRATTLGYRLEEFDMNRPGMNSQRMAQILHARGISGALIAPQPHTRVLYRLRMDLSKLSVVTFGYSLIWPKIHLVTSHHPRVMRIIMRKLRSYGYGRIGLCLNQVLHGRSDGGWLGGYLTEMARHPASERIPPLIYGEWNARVFEKWFRTTKPEALILHNVGDAGRVRSLLGLKTPEECGIACLSLQETEQGYAGVDQNSQYIGEAAVNFLVSLIHANERGVPEVPQRVMIEGKWIDGPSIVRQNTSKAIRSGA